MPEVDVRSPSACTYTPAHTDTPSEHTKNRYTMHAHKNIWRKHILTIYYRFLFYYNILQN